MDNWLYFLRFRARDRWELTKHTFLFIFFSLLFLYGIYSIIFRYALPLDASTLKLIWDKTPELILSAIFGAIILLVLVVFLQVREELGLFMTEHCFIFNPKDCLNNIDFQGMVTFEPKEKALSVTNSGSGILFHRPLLNYYWRDFEAIFEFKFLGEEKGKSLKTSYELTKLGSTYCTQNNYLGFIFRAKDLDNYFMLSIGAKKYQERICEPKCEEPNKEGKKILLVTPHIKIGGMWEVFEGKKFTLPKELPRFKIEDYIFLRIVVRGTRLDLWLGELAKKRGQECQELKEEMHLFTWDLPTHYSVNWSDGQNKEKEQDDKSYSPGDSSKIPFRNSIGRIGFRAYGDERFLIRDLTIKKID